MEAVDEDVLKFDRRKMTDDEIRVAFTRAAREGGWRHGGQFERDGVLHVLVYRIARELRNGGAAC